MSQYDHTDHYPSQRFDRAAEGCYDQVLQPEPTSQPSPSSSLA
jgi:hypothetical protein